MFGFHRELKTSTTFQSRLALILAFSTLLLFFATTPGRAESINSTIQDGIASYHQNDFKQAESDFSKAAKELPDSPKLNYNLGNSRYKTGKFQEALQTYKKALADDTPAEIKQKSLFNTGNTLFRLGKLEESATAYKKVLEMDPRDMDAKFNLEFVREQLKKKKEEQQKQNQPQDSKSKGSQDQEQNPSPGDNSENEQGNPSDREDQKPSSAGETEQNAQPLPAEQQEASSSNLVQSQDKLISKDQADHWLSALNEDLKKFRQKQAQKEEAGSPHKNRDW